MIFKIGNGSLAIPSIFQMVKVMLQNWRAASSWVWKFDGHDISLSAGSALSATIQSPEFKYVMVL
jgi:hypothetical protein